MTQPKRYPIETGEPADPTVPLPSSADPDAMLEEDHSPPTDGGVAQHPLHDSDLDDRQPEDFEDELTPTDPQQLPDMLPTDDDGTVRRRA